MYVIIKIDIQEIDGSVHSSIVSVCDDFAQSLNKCNNYITESHGGPYDVVYRDLKNRFTHYIRGYVYGKRLRTIYEIINYQQTKTPRQLDQQHELNGEQVFLSCPLCLSCSDDASPL